MSSYPLVSRLLSMSPLEYVTIFHKARAQALGECGFSAALRLIILEWWSLTPKELSQQTRDWGLESRRSSEIQRLFANLALPPGQSIMRLVNLERIHDRYIERCSIGLGHRNWNRSGAVENIVHQWSAAVENIPGFEGHFSNWPSESATQQDHYLECGALEFEYLAPAGSACPDPQVIFPTLLDLAIAEGGPYRRLFT